MATPEPSRDAWGLLPAVPDPPPTDVEIGVTTDGDGWGPTRPRVSNGDLARAVSLAGLFKVRYLIIKRGLHRKRMH